MLHHYYHFNIYKVLYG